MAPLAMLLLQRGDRVSGSDRAAGAKTGQLAAAGARITIGHAAEQLPGDTETVVYSSAVGPDNPEYAAAVGRGLPLLRRGEMLAEFAAGYRRTVAVSGSHGKSSITALLAHILTQCGAEPGFMIGAAVNGGNSAAGGREADIFITEADESDGTHTALHPWLGIVPNLDEDHAWSVGGVAALHRNFRTFAANCRQLLYFGAELPDRLFAGHPGARRLELPPEGFCCAGFHGFQARNAALAVAAAEYFGVERERAEAAAAGFPGIARRMTRRFVSPDLTIIEDYAHHPVEVAASIAFLRESYPRHHLRVLFQPHRYARLAAFFDGFVTALRGADSVIVAPVFAAWSERGAVDSAALARACGGTAPAGGWDRLAAAALSRKPADRPLLLAVLGAGDIEAVFSFLPGS